MGCHTPSKVMSPGDLVSPEDMFRVLAKQTAFDLREACVHSRFARFVSCLRRNPAQYFPSRRRKAAGDANSAPRSRRREAVDVFLPGGLMNPPRFRLAFCILLLSAACSLADAIVSRPAGFIRLEVAAREARLVGMPFQAQEDAIAHILGGHRTPS